MSVWEQFIEDLRNALNNMHDPNRLRQSALAQQLGVSNDPDIYAALSKILTEAIGALEPVLDEPPNSRAWRIYDLLTARYIQGLSSEAVADQIGLSIRHLRREQHAAIETLGHHLWQQFRQETDSAARAADVTSPVAPEEDLSWVRDTAPEHPADLDGALTMALELVSTLASSRGARLEKVAPAPIPHLSVHTLALEQILLAMLSAGINCASGGVLRVEVTPATWEVEIRVQAENVPQGRQVARDDQISLQVAAHLAEMSGGNLAVLCNEPFAAVAALPVLEQLPVLAIDDNADVLQLYNRFVAGTRFRLAGLRDPQQAIAWAQQNKPGVILLDVMMPGLDGWRLLSRLKLHPATSAIPVIICTILNQRDLALSLGATDFLPKPVSQSALLAALHRAVAQASPGSN